MAYSVSTSELDGMSEEQRVEADRKLARGAFRASNGDARDVDLRIDRFERVHGMTSRELLERLMAGEQGETEAIFEWLWLLNFRADRLS